MPRPLPLRSSLQGELVDRILAIVRNGLRDGERLREAALARQLGVSRSPVRAALKHLVGDGTLRSEPAGGYSVLRTPGPAAEGIDGATGRDRLYSLLLRDIILAAIRPPVSESALMRRYRASRGELSKVLRRLVREGLAEPLPGRGWMLLSLSVDRLCAGYHLRMIVEPAMLNDPSFRVSAEVLAQLRCDHQKAQASISAKTPWQWIFDLDANFHEALAAGTGNDLILEMVRRENRLRRLGEYASYRRLERVRASIAEHLQIIDALFAGNHAWASALMRQHLMISLQETRQHVAGDLGALKKRPAQFPQTIGPSRRRRRAR